MNIEKGALEFVAWLEAIVKGIDGDINELKELTVSYDKTIETLNKRSTEQQIEIEKLLATVTKMDEFLKRVYK